MARPRTEKPLGYEPYPDLAKAQMFNLVHALNGPIHRISQTKGGSKQRVKLKPLASQQELRRLVQRWMDSGPDLIEMFTTEPELETRLSHGRTRFYPMHDGRGHLDWSPEISGTTLPPHEHEALQDFMILITSPLWKQLGGPCSRCKDYYLKKTKRQKVYCSRACALKTTAASAMRQRRQQEQGRKIRNAQSLIDEWSKNKRRLAWKDWVSNRTGYTVRWITRAVNNGELRPPDGAVS